MSSPATRTWKATLFLAVMIVPFALLRSWADESAEESLRSAHWIWCDGPRERHQTAFLRRTFAVGANVTAARLVGVADFSHATVFLNGQPVIDVEPYGPRFAADVTQQILAGRNVLAVHCNACDGPSAVAMVLHATLQDGTAFCLPTESTWLASTQQEANWTGLDFAPSSWKPAADFGQVADEPWGSANDTKISPLDDYTQWKRALGSGEGADPSTFLVPDGFQIELLRSATDKEGSWVSLAFDPQDRIVIAKEGRGLLRMTLAAGGDEVADVELIEDTLLECRGLLFAFDSLYVNANNSKGMYRLRDTDDDGQFDEVKLLYQSPGGVGHGRNDLALGPDNLIYSIHGDAVDLPRDGFRDLTSPFREHHRGERTREGHVIRIDPAGENWEVVTAGLRNPFGIDFNSDGEMFTYDADAEHDMGSPWYRPTRVNHLLPGGDFGWRGVTGRWPPYYPDRPDAAPPTLDIGKGSPTAVKFSYRSNFPPKYRRALFVLDWAYGRIIAVHMSPRGASYACRAEPFLSGRPLNVTDLDFGPDGAMYVVTGGRKTQSGLYRIRYDGPVVDAPPATPQQIARAEHAAEARQLRRWLESLHGAIDADTVDVAWPHLDDPDPTIRHAARIAIEHQPVEAWQSRALSEERPTAALTALMSLAAGGKKESTAKIAARLCKMPLAECSESQLLLALRTYQLCLESGQRVSSGLQPTVVRQLDSLYPHSSAAVNQELSKLLVQLDAASVVRKTLDLLDHAEQQSEQLHYLFVLRNAQVGWTPELRDRYFEWFRQTTQFTGGEGMPGFLRQIREDALAALDEDERAAATAILRSVDRGVRPVSLPSEHRSFVREWTVEDVLASSPKIDRNPDFARGKAVFAEAACIGCHRMGSEGSVVGPDLTSVASRFSQRDILESIIRPSKVVAENYRSDVIVTTSGQVITGRITQAGDYRSPVLRISTDPLDPSKAVLVPKAEVESHRRSPISRMPKGLLNTFTKEEILDLLAYIQSADNIERPILQH